MTTAYVHKMSKNTIVECAVSTVASRYGGKDRKSKQLSVARTIGSSLLTSTNNHYLLYLNRFKTC